MDKTKGEILLEAQNQIARKNFYKDWHDFNVKVLGRIDGSDTFAIDEAAKLAMELYAEQCNRDKENRIKELLEALNDSVEQMYYMMREGIDPTKASTVHTIKRFKSIITRLEDGSE